MTPLDFREALALPASANVDRRVPKRAFIEQIKGVADRKAFDTLVDRLDWQASLSPGSIGVMAASDADKAVEEIQLFTLATRREPTQRLAQVIHQALPYPLVLISHWPHAAAIRLSLLPIHHTEPKLLSVGLQPGAALEAFLQSLALSQLPRSDLAALYDGLVERALALLAAQVSGGAYRLPANADDAASRRQALADYMTTDAAYRSIKSAAEREKRLAQGVELGTRARSAKLALDAARRALL